MIEKKLLNWFALVGTILFLGVAVAPSVVADDIIPPVTTISFNPPEPNGDNGWFICTVTVELIAYDNESGVNHTFVRINGGSIQMYMGPFPIVFEGITLIEYYSVDNAGNIEPIKETSLKIDYTEPITDVMWEGIGNPIKGYIFRPSVMAIDEVSGVERAEFVRFRYRDGYREDLGTDYISDPSGHYDCEAPVLIKGYCWVKGTIFIPWKLDDKTRFLPLLVEVWGDEFVLYVEVYDFAGNVGKDSMGLLGDRWIYVLHPFEFDSEYTGILQPFQVDAMFDNIPIEMQLE